MDEEIVDEEEDYDDGGDGESTLCFYCHTKNDVSNMFCFACGATVLEEPEIDEEWSCTCDCLICVLIFRYEGSLYCMKSGSFGNCIQPPDIPF
jgi:hypothetical protein